MYRKLMALVILIFCSLISACSQPYSSHTIAVEGDKPTFTGIHPASIEGSTQNTVILIHGMCTHDKDWLTKVTANMRFASETKSKTLVTGSKTDVEVHKKHWKEGDNEINFYGIIYSPELNKVKKETLCSDIKQPNGKKAFCDGSQKNDRVRAVLNNKVKEEFMNDCLADAVVYSGDAGVKVRQGVRDALVAIEKDSIKTNQTQNKTPITLVSQSLGSKVLRDALVCEDNTNEEISNKSFINQVDRNVQYLSDTQQVFLVSNQIALLNRGNSGHCKTNEKFTKQQNSVRSSSSPNKSGVFDLFDLISNTKKQNIRSFSNGVRQSKFNVVSFTDPNDLLSYEVDPKEYKNYPVTNVIVSNAITFFGLIANPITAHLGYFANSDVRRLLRCGRGLSKTKMCNLQSSN